MIPRTPRSSSTADANLLIAVGTGPGGTDQVYLSDFGPTKRTETTSGLTRTGAFMGTLDYVPPEQINGQRIDGRSDQYALTCVLFECLTGGVPFDQQDEAVRAPLRATPIGCRSASPAACSDRSGHRSRNGEGAGAVRDMHRTGLAARAAAGMGDRTSSSAVLAVGAPADEVEPAATGS